MAHTLLRVGALLAWLAGLSPHLARADAVDCSKATTPTQRVVCANPALAKMDKQAEDDLKRNVIIFNDGTANGGPVLADFNAMVKQWLERREQCAGKPDCLKEAYTDLLATLEFHGRPGKQSWADKAAGAFTYQGFANLFIQVRDDDSVRVSLSEFDRNGSNGSCSYVTFGKQDGKILKAGTLDLELLGAQVNVAPTEANLRTNTQSCQNGGSMIWRYALRR